jgi:transketolase
LTALRFSWHATVILAKTVKGMGVSFMENDAGWHGKAPDDEQYARAKAELDATLNALEGHQNG